MESFLASKKIYFCLAILILCLLWGEVFIVFSWLNLLFVPFMRFAFLIKGTAFPYLNYKNIRGLFCKAVGCFYPFQCSVIIQEALVWSVPRFLFGFKYYSYFQVICYLRSEPWLMYELLKMDHDIQSEITHGSFQDPHPHILVASQNKMSVPLKNKKRKKKNYNK